jgi:hypothetical protein
MVKECMRIWDTYITDLPKPRIKCRSYGCNEALHSFCLVPCIFLPTGPRSIFVVYCVSLLWFFYSLQMVSGQQILEGRFKEFSKGFYCCLEISCSHPCLRKNKFKDSNSMDPKMLAILLFHFFQERFFLFQLFYFIVHQIFFVFSVITQTRLR